MPKGTIFMNNRTQSVRIPAEYRFPDEVKTVSIRKVGNTLVLTPSEGVWDNFFLSEERPTEDFMQDRGEQSQAERESF